MAEVLKVFINGQFVESSTDKFFDVYNPSTGEVIAKAPCCTPAEVQSAIDAAKAAFPAGSAPCHAWIHTLLTRPVAASSTS